MLERYMIDVHIDSEGIFVRVDLIDKNIAILLVTVGRTTFAVVCDEDEWSLITPTRDRCLVR